MPIEVPRARVRPPCEVCAQPVDRLQQSRGVAIAYPCQHWHTPTQAQTVANAAHRLAERTSS